MNSNALREIVLYDFDGTITRRDTVIPFILRCGRLSRLVSLSIHAILKSPKHIVGRDRDFVKESVIAASLADLSIDEIDRVVVRHVQSIMKRGVRSAVLETIRSHVQQGHEVVIVSASFGVYLDLVAKEVGAAHVIATELEVEGKYLTGRLATKNCRSVEKVARVEAWLATQDETVVVAAYGNSTDDLYLLRYAQTGYLVSRRGIVPVHTQADI